MLAFLVTLLTAGSALGQAQSAVLPVLAYGVPSDRVQSLEAALIRTVGDAAGGVMGAEDTAMLLQAAEDTVTCPRSELSCLVEIGSLMAVRRLVLAKAEQTPEGLQLTLTVIDVTEARARRRVRETLTGAVAAQDTQLRTLVFRLFHDSAAVLGGLIVEVEEAGAQLFVDEQPVGASPLPGPLLGLDAGTHTVRAVLEGLPPVEQSVDIAPGAVVQIRLRVTPRPKEQGVNFEALRTFGWSVVGVGSGGVLLGLLGTVAGLGMTAYAWIGGGRVPIELLAFAGYIYACYDEEQSSLSCSPREVQRTRETYDEISVGTQIAAAVGVPGTIVAVLSVGAIVAGSVMLVFARYAELSQQLEAEADAERALAAPTASLGPLSQRVADAVLRQRSGL